MYVYVLCTSMYRIRTLMHTHTFYRPATSRIAAAKPRVWRSIKCAFQLFDVPENGEQRVQQSSIATAAEIRTLASWYTHQCTAWLSLSLCCIPYRSFLLCWGSRWHKVCAVGKLYAHTMQLRNNRASGTNSDDDDDTNDNEFNTTVRSCSPPASLWGQHTRHERDDSMVVGWIYCFMGH